MAWKPDYLSEAELNRYVHIPNGDTLDDAEVARAIASASRRVDLATGRQFGKVDAAVTRSYPVRWSRTLCSYYADIDDLMDLTGLVVSSGGTTIDAADYKLRPRNAAADGKPYEYILIDVAVTDDLDMLGLWGWNAYPEGIKQAVAVHSAWLLGQRNQPYGGPPMNVAVQPWTRSWVAR